MWITLLVISLSSLELKLMNKWDAKTWVPIVVVVTMAIVFLSSQLINNSGPVISPGLALEEKKKVTLNVTCRLRMGGDLLIDRIKHRTCSGNLEDASVRACKNLFRDTIRPTPTPNQLNKTRASITRNEEMNIRCDA